MIRKTLFISALFMVLTFPAQTGAFSGVSTNIALDDAAYRYIDQLAGYGYIQGYLGSIRPLTRLEVGRLLCEALDYLEDNSIVSKPAFFDRLVRQFQEEIDLIRGKTKPEAVSITPVEEFSLSYGYLDGPFSTYNNEGVDFHDGHNAVAELRSRTVFWNHLGFYINPLFLYNETAADEPDKDHTELTLHHVYGKLGAANFEIEVGRDSLWWGPAYHGALLLSNNARPFDMVKLSNPRPAKLPWILRYLGPFQFNLFLTELDDARPIAKPYLYGLRFDFKPHPHFEIGLSHIAIFGGEGRRGLSIEDYFNILYGNRNRDDTKLDSNQQLALDIAWRIPNLHRLIPLARSLKIYGEIGAEDTGFPPDRRAYIAGIRFYDLFLIRNLIATVEYVDTAPEVVRHVWYRHDWYPATYKGDVFGHHAGTDAEDLYFSLSYDVTDVLWASLSFDHERRMVTAPEAELRYRGALEVEYALTPRQTISAVCGYERVANVGSVSGVDQENHLAGVRYRFHF